MFKFLCRIPTIGAVFRIINAYAFHGDRGSGKKFAGFRRWFRALCPEALMAALLSIFTNFDYLYKSYDSGYLLPCSTGFACSPGSLLTSILPSILGFGIGVYALVFALSPEFIKQAIAKFDEQHESGERRFGSVLMFNADLTFPLLALLGMLALAVVQQISPNTMWLMVATWWGVWYALLQVLSLVSVINGLADLSIMDKGGLK